MSTILLNTEIDSYEELILPTNKPTTVHLCKTRKDYHIGRYIQSYNVVIITRLMSYTQSKFPIQ